MSHVYHLLTEAEPFSEKTGGAISRWVANVLKKDSSSTIIAPSADETWGFKSFRVRCVPAFEIYRSIPHRIHIPWPIQRPWLTLILRKALHDLRPGDIVWIHNRLEFTAAITPFVHNAGARVVLHLHNTHLMRPVVKQVSPDLAVCCSDFIRQDALKTYPKLTNACVVYNGADEDMFLPNPLRHGRFSETPSLLFAGRLIPDKGAHVFVEAMRLLEQRGVRVHALLVGASALGGNTETPYLQELRRRAASNTSFAPYCTGNALAEKFQQADIFCCPSIWPEPFGMVNVEAMACGTPVIASNIGGIPEVFAEGGALLVQPNSAPKLAEAIESLIKNPRLTADLGAAGLRSFKKLFTWPKIYQQYLGAIESISGTSINHSRSKIKQLEQFCD